MGNYIHVFTSFDITLSKSLKKTYLTNKSSLIDYAYRQFIKSIWLENEVNNLDFYVLKLKKFKREYPVIFLK